MNLLTKQLSVACLGVCAALPAMAAQPDGQTYAELSYAWLTLSSTGYDVTATDAIGRFGYEFTKNVGAEIFGATSLSSGELNGISVKVDSAYGAYLKLRTEASPGFEIFGRLGWVDATLKASVPGASASSSDNSFSYGVGAQYTFSDKWYFQVDYMSYYDKDGDTIRGPSMGLGIRF